MAKGFLYVLTNPTMPGLTKVGKTTREPDIRVAELSSPTGVPQPFSLAFQQPVADCHSAEAWVHSELERGGYRHAQNREFFNAPLHVVVQIVAQAAKLIPITAGDGEDARQISTQSSEQLAEDLYDLGFAYMNGTDTTLPDTGKAVKCFEQAAALGHAAACSAAGSMYRWGSGGVKQDLEMALSIYLRSVDLGTWSDLAVIAGIFAERKQTDTAKKYWNQFFEAARDNYGEVRDLNIRLYGVWYCEAVATGELEHSVDDLTVVHFASLLVAGIENWIATLDDDQDKGYAEFKQGRLRAARMFIERLKAEATSQ
ncbi:hypothetical protein ebA355 [Aromatoleum aromaticum EbN1]|uniref:Bacteriophage T5 Orf172 DNA-binding domain-containing protein n=1 Tax=Aromatoleum aromaticum (strain DSM 19018 / LMG 30748 / EbN1) TaxID=76114 RepID=Q5P8Q1_AROAE|nr:GIY-YIG nuclease family protein [Aromatoleum aromaticum]CAI06308.1 hypothetical protein ebA355 [Aromatoleum aromaticum EbN1]